MYVEEGRAEKAGSNSWSDLCPHKKRENQIKGRNRVQNRVRSMTGMEGKGRGRKGRGVFTQSLSLSIEFR